MISPGIGVHDGNAPDLQSPFGNLFAGNEYRGSTSGAAGDRLDDVAYYGHTHDLRSDLPATQNVTFYAVNAMGGPTGAALLSSAAKYGGFEDRNKTMRSMSPAPDLHLSDWIESWERVEGQ